MLLSTGLWAGALIRRVEAGGGFAMVLRRGDRDGGAVLVKVFDRGSGDVRLYSETRAPDGEPAWMQPVPDADQDAVDAYVERRLRFDPDLWVIEVEDRAGRHFLTEPVLDR